MTLTKRRSLVTRHISDAVTKRVFASNALAKGKFLFVFIAIYLTL